MKKKNKSAKQPKNLGSKIAEKAELAMKYGFYLEASMIMSTMFEKRLKKLIGKLENQLPGPGFTLEQTIKRVKYLHLSEKYPGLTARISIGLIDEIRNWKNQRNEILKDLPEIHVSLARVERLAKEGNRLLKEWKKAGKTFKSE